MNKGGFALQDFNVENILSLMEIYLNEWSNRIDQLWNQVFKFFYATLIVLFLPNLSSAIGIDLSMFPSVIFPITSFGLSIIFLYVSLAHVKRLEASTITYQNLIDCLPPELQRVHLADPRVKHGKFFSHAMRFVTCILMFIGLLLMSIMMIIYYCKSLFPF